MVEEISQRKMLAADDQRKFEKGTALDHWRWKFFVSQVCLTLYFAMSSNGQTHFKDLAVFVARFLKCVWQFYDIAN